MSANVLVVHGGGPTAVINASLYGVVEEAKKSAVQEHIPDPMLPEDSRHGIIVLLFQGIPG